MKSRNWSNFIICGRKRRERITTDPTGEGDRDRCVGYAIHVIVEEVIHHLLQVKYDVGTKQMINACVFDYFH